MTYESLGGRVVFPMTLSLFKDSFIPKINADSKEDQYDIEAVNPVHMQSVIIFMRIEESFKANNKISDVDLEEIELNYTTPNSNTDTWSQMSADERFKEMTKSSDPTTTNATRKSK